MHKATPRFWECFGVLSETLQKVARKNYKLLKKNPHHPSLHFKKVGKFWSVRVGINHRALAVKDGEVLFGFGLEPMKSMNGFSNCKSNKALHRTCSFARILVRWRLQNIKNYTPN